MNQGTQGSTGTENTGIAGPVRVPQQARAADADAARVRQARGQGGLPEPQVERTRAADAVPKARGGRPPAEQPMPTPRVLPAEQPMPRPRASSAEQPLPTPPAGHRARPVVQRASVRGQILDALRTALVSGELTPGEVYSAPVLGDRFGVSATPVREAMQQLALEGAVEVVPNRGFRVVERGARELAELAEIRALVEVPVMLRLARTVPAERWAELRPLAEATVRAASTGSRATYAEADRAFHRAVLALAGNAQLVQIADDLHRRAQWPLTGTPTSRGRAELVADAAEHTALLDALIAGDLDVVRSLVAEHFGGAS
ncbi:DNA-binding GntR family transcriptional regulator [Streptomyces sp. TLI_55]|uniref:GntR family transcriptional regulator n=1 Tax=Streptomyces sp. TLI_55 TaxID=1938861 RepID=UPI000BD49085|nr:GntR family transcriptional regulator [Streptomyces sp. TLI_55]SNX64839.1 DNA-binding GntR family transcriptional regulator [Streptomyces sp. TLI_55]